MVTNQPTDKEYDEVEEFYAELDDFYAELDDILRSIKRNDFTVVIGDFNERREE